MPPYSESSDLDSEELELLLLLLLLLPDSDSDDDTDDTAPSSTHSFHTKKELNLNNRSDVECFKTSRYEGAV